jgi:hypothetical protein
VPKRGLSNEPAAVSPIDSLFPQSSYDNLTGMKQLFKTLISKKCCFLGVLLSFSCLSLTHADSWRLANEWVPHPRCIELIDLGDRHGIDRCDRDRLGVGLEVFNGG